MLRGILIAISLVMSVLLMTSCSNSPKKLQNVGMLVESEIKDNPWNEKGFLGLETIKQTYDINVYVKENINTSLEVEKAVDELTNNGVNLVFGHGPVYGKYFSELAKYYPDVHFVYFNGNYSDHNITSLNINPHAVGFFSGMIAGEVTEEDEIGVIAAYEWQPELEGFFEGVKYNNPDAHVHMDFVNDREEDDVALKMYETMEEESIDVVFPMGIEFSEQIVRVATSEGNYAIGYIEDQSYIDKDLVLTSTVHHVEQLYEQAALSFEKGTLQGGVYTYDLSDDIITLGQMSPDIEEDFIEELNQAIEMYIEMNILPNEQEMVK